jgi:hypothetical protein
MSWWFQSFIGILLFNLESDSPDAKVYKAVGCSIEYSFLFQEAPVQTGRHHFLHRLLQIRKKECERTPFLLGLLLGIFDTNFG